MPYWNAEEPEYAETCKNVIRYFQAAKKLQISNPYWTNDAGEQMPGKTVALDLKALRECPEAMTIVRRATRDDS